MDLPQMVAKMLSPLECLVADVRAARDSAWKCTGLMSEHVSFEVSLPVPQLV